MDRTVDDDKIAEIIDLPVKSDLITDRVKGPENRFKEMMAMRKAISIGKRPNCLRNKTCLCGSGLKFKQCCGRVRRADKTN